MKNEDTAILLPSLLLHYLRLLAVVIKMKIEHRSLTIESDPLFLLRCSYIQGSLCYVFAFLPFSLSSSRAPFIIATSITLRRGKKIPRHGLRAPIAGFPRDVSYTRHRDLDRSRCRRVCFKFALSSALTRSPMPMTDNPPRRQGRTFPFVSSSLLFSPP